jgi:hypothetical protein
MQPKIILPFLVVSFFILSCKQQGKPFCANDCLEDSLKFIKEDHDLKPYVYISADDCQADTIAWSYSGMGTNQKLPLGHKLSKENVACFIYDTSHAFVLYNTCPDGRGYFLKLFFDKKTSILRSSGALNKFDPKFSVEDGLLAYTDKGNIFVEEMATGTKAMMTFGERVDMDLDDIHETLETVTITRSKISAKVKIADEWKTIEKNITLQ